MRGLGAAGRPGAASAWMRVALGLAMVACSVEEAPVGPPRCEPSTELLVERGLKRGYREIVNRDSRAAEKAFREVLKQAPGHPEARSGLLELERLGRSAALMNSRMAIMVAGRPAPMSASVNSERMRYEEEVVQRPMRGRIDGGRRRAPRPMPFASRTTSRGEVVDVLDAKAVRNTIDIIVIHDTFTDDARTFFVESAEEGKSTHFLIDYDGTIYQTLDLARAARHTGLADVDRRSVDITLANPVDRDRPALPSTATGFSRALSGKTMRHGREVVQWGYTDAQIRSLRQLVNGLIRALPGVPAQLARGPGGTIQQLLPKHGQGFRGVVGHAQLSKKATDPSVALDWDVLRIP